MLKPILSTLLVLASIGSAHAQAPLVEMPPARPPMVRPVVNPPSFPTPGATPAGAGIEVPAPSGEVQVVPRSPNKRILPATTEPGLWAADGAPQSAAASGRRKVFDIDIPSGTSVEDMTVTAECSSALAAVMGRAPVLDKYISRLADDVRRCLAFTAFLHCASTLSVELAAGRFHHPTFSPTAITHTANRALLLKQRYCDGVELDTQHEDALKEVKRRWEEEELAARLRIP